MRGKEGGGTGPLPLHDLSVSFLSLLNLSSGTTSSFNQVYVCERGRGGGGGTTEKSNSLIEDHARRSRLSVLNVLDGPPGLLVLSLSGLKSRERLLDCKDLEVNEVELLLHLGDRELEDLKLVEGERPGKGGLGSEVGDAFL